MFTRRSNLAYPTTCRYKTFPLILGMISSFHKPLINRNTNLLRKSWFKERCCIASFGGELS